MNRAQIFNPIDRLRSRGSSLILTNDSNDQILTGNKGDIYIKPKGLGNFRVHSGDSVGGGAAPSIIPGSIHVGPSAVQGAADSYIDINESETDNNATGKTLMRFAYTNAGTNFATGQSITLNTKSPTTKAITILSTMGGEGGSLIHNLLQFGHNITPITTALSDISLMRTGTNTIGGSLSPAATRYAFCDPIIPSSNRITSVALYTARRGVVQFPTNSIGLYFPTMGGGTRRWAVLAGEPIQLAQDKALIFDGPTMATNSHDTITTVGDTDMRYTSAASALDTYLNGTQLLRLASAYLGPGSNGGTGLGTNGAGWADIWFKDTSAAFEDRVLFTSSAALTADRTLTVDVDDGSRTVKIQGNPTLDDWFDQSVKAAATPQFARIGLGVAADGTIELTVNTAASAPSTTLGVTAVNRYGGDTNYLGDPVAWMPVRVAGTNYKIPLYT
jgi:hypothetical protein